MGPLLQSDASLEWKDNGPWARGVGALCPEKTSPGRDDPSITREHHGAGERGLISAKKKGKRKKKKRKKKKRERERRVSRSSSEEDGKNGSVSASRASRVHLVAKSQEGGDGGEKKRRGEKKNSRIPQTLRPALRYLAPS